MLLLLFLGDFEDRVGTQKEHGGHHQHDTREEKHQLVELELGFGRVVLSMLLQNPIDFLLLLSPGHLAAGDGNEARPAAVLPEGLECL